MIDAVTSTVQPAGQATTASGAEIPRIFVRVQTFWWANLLRTFKRMKEGNTKYVL